MPTPQKESVNNAPIIEETPQDLSTIPSSPLSVTPFGAFPYGEPFTFVSDVPINAGQTDVGSVSASSYAIEYSAGGGRNEIRNLLADTFQINDNNNDQPSPGPSFPAPDEVTDSEFFSIDVRPVLASDVGSERTDSGGNYGSTINSYTSFLSRPDLWRPTNGGVFEVAGISDLKHYSLVPPQETRMAEANWPGTVVGYATGFIDKDNPNRIINVQISFEGQPTTCNGVDPGYTVVYAGDLVHDRDKSATATNGYLQRNTRVDTVSGTTYILNKPHTYNGNVGIAHTFTVRRIGPSKIDREYGYYHYHYYLDEGQQPSSPEDFKLVKEYTSEYSYAYYYGKKPDGINKTGSSALGAAGVDGNITRYTQYNTTGRWGVYIDDEVKNYLEGRTFIGHNQGIGVGAATATINGNAGTKVQPDPILSVFNNRFKNQDGELDIGSSNCPGTRVGTHGDYDFDQYQMGLYVEDIAAIGTRPDIRYRLSVDGTATGAGILAKFTSATTPKAAYFKGDVDITGTVTATTFDGNLKVTTSNSNSNFKIPFANTTASTTGNYGLLQDSTATFTYNPSSNTLTAGTFSGSLSGNATSATDATNTTNFDVAADNSTNATHYIIFTGGATGNQRPNSDTGLTYNPSSNTLTAGTFSGSLSGNATSANTATNQSGGSVNATTGDFSSRVIMDNDLYIGETAEFLPSSSTATGFNLLSDGGLRVARDNALPIAVMRQGGDGGLINFLRSGTVDGSINVASGVVSYNPFLGVHWGRLNDNSKPEIPIGTILETTNKLIEWKIAIFEVDGEEKRAAYNKDANIGDIVQIEYNGQTYDAIIKNEEEILPDMNKHVCVKVNDTRESKAVFGVFLGWDDEIPEGMIETWNDISCASVGNFFIRIASEQNLEIGDLITSDGNGCGVVQSDDIVRSKTVCKVTSTIPQITYDDGSFLVTCVLYCG